MPFFPQSAIPPGICLANSFHVSTYRQNPVAHTLHSEGGVLKPYPDDPFFSQLDRKGENPFLLFPPDLLFRKRLGASVPGPGGRRGLPGNSRRDRRTASRHQLRLGQRSARGVALWGTIYTISAYEARIYAFVPSVWGGSQLLTLTGRGYAGGPRPRLGRKAVQGLVRYAIRRTSVGFTTSWATQVELGNL